VKGLAEGSRPMPAVVVVNDGGMWAEIKRKSPQTYVVFRGNVVGIEPHPFAGLREDGTGTVADPVAWYHYMERWNSQAPAADAYSLYNERTFGGNAPSSDGKSTHSVGGGLRHADLAAMRTRACMRQPIDALRRMPDASEAARPPSAAFGPSCIPLQQRESSPESAPSSKATPTGGKSC